jgi:hypothetical protein
MGRRARDGKSLSLQDLTDQSDYPGQERRLLRFAMFSISPSGEGRASYRLLWVWILNSLSDTVYSLPGCDIYR